MAKTTRAETFETASALPEGTEARSVVLRDGRTVLTLSTTDPKALILWIVERQKEVADYLKETGQHPF